MIDFLLFSQLIAYITTNVMIKNIIQFHLQCSLWYIIVISAYNWGNA